MWEAVNYFIYLILVAEILYVALLALNSIFTMCLFS
jgi:hypothetical protein